MPGAWRQRSLSGTGLVKVHSEKKLACTAHARERACREGGGTVRRGGEEGCSGGSLAESMDSQEAMAEEAARSPEKMRDGNLKLSISSWRAHVALFSI